MTRYVKNVSNSESHGVMYSVPDDPKKKVTLTFTYDEWKRLDAVAAKHELALSTYIKSMILYFHSEGAK